MNLENLGLVELNAQEVLEVDGGFFPFVIVLAFYLLHPLVYVFKLK